MKTFRLSWPTSQFTIRLPAESEETLRFLYPGVEEVAGDRPDRPDSGSTARFEIAAAGAVWRLAIDREDAGRFATLSHALLAVEHRMVEKATRSAGGWIAFHAGAVDVGGAACLLAGAPEAGKTSSTVQLLELGHSFVADEVALVNPRSGTVAPFYRTPALGPGFVADRFGDAGPSFGRLVDFVPSVARYLPWRRTTAPVEVSTLLLPRYRPGAATELSRLDAGAGLTEVLGYCFEPVGEREEFLDRLIALLERWAILRFTYGGATEAREVLAGRFPSPGPAASENAG